MENTYSGFIENAKRDLHNEYAHRLIEIIERGTDNGSLLENVKQMFKSGFGEIFTLPEWTSGAIWFVIALILLSVFENSFKSKGVYTSVCYVTRLSLTAAVMLPISSTLSEACTYMQEISTFIGVLTPTVGVITAAGGNVATAKVTNFFLTVFLSAFQIILNKIVPTVCAVFFGFAIIDAAGTDSKMLTLSNTARNVLFGAFSILTTVFFILLNTQSLAASSAENFSAKTLRLVIGSAVPIVGGTIGDALKLVGGSLVSVKSTVGVAAVVFLLLMYLPLLVILWGNGILMNVFMFLCDYFAISSAKGVFIHMKYILDFVLAAFTSLFIIGIVNIGVFMKTSPALFSG